MNYPSEFPDTWEEFTWPAWVPKEVSARISRFWSPTNGRTINDWVDNARKEGFEPFSGVCEGHVTSAKDEELFKGHHVHAWNNMCRIVPLMLGETIYKVSSYDGAFRLLEPTPAMLALNSADYSIAEWKAEARRRDGDNARDWAFTCPICAQEQCGADFEVAGRDGQLACTMCLGRYVDREKDCDYASGGLINANPVTVKMDDGRIVHVFDFAEGVLCES